MIDGRLAPLPRAPRSVRRRLAVQPGYVVSRSELLAALPFAAGDEHAVEMAVSRLRTALGDGSVVRTVVKRGYCLTL